MTDRSHHRDSSLLLGPIVTTILLAIGLVFFGLTGCTSEDSDEGAAQGPAPGEPGPIVDLEPMVVNLSNTERTHYLKVSISVELADAAAAALYEPRKVQARHSVLMTLRALTLAETQDVDEQERIRQRLQEQLENVIGPRTVRGVYFTDFVTQ